MARKIVAEPGDSEKFGIRVSYDDKTTGWIVGQNGEIALFKSQREAAKALKAIKTSDNYTLNCCIEVVQFGK